MEVDEAAPGMQPSSNETDGGFQKCEVEDRQDARVEVQGPKRRVTRVESEETQDYVRGTLAISQEEADEIGIVRSALSEPRGVYYWCDDRCSDESLRYMQITSMVIEEGDARTINLCKLCYNAKKNGKRRWRRRHIGAGYGRSSDVSNFGADYGSEILSRGHGQGKF